MPTTILNTDGTPSLDAAPVPGLTNTQLWNQYHLAIGGAVASCATVRSRMSGAYACAGAQSPQAPSPPTNIRT